MLADFRTKRFLLAGAAALLCVSGIASAQAPAAEPTEKQAPKELPAAKPDAPKADKPQAADPSLPAGKDIIAKFVEATGGKGAYEKIKSRRATGAVEIPSMGMKGAVTILTASPNRMRFSMDLPGAGASEQTTDGQDAWSTNSMMGPSLMEAEQRDQVLASAVFNPELHLDDLYSSINTTASEKVGDEDCYVLVLTPKKGNPETRYYAKGSKLLIKTTTTAQTPMGEITTEVAPGDWKDVDGVKQAHSMTMKQMGMEMKVSFDKIEHNVDLPADTFAMPAEIKALKDKGAGDKKDEPAAAPAKPVQPAPAGDKKEPAPGGSK